MKAKPASLKSCVHANSGTRSVAMLCPNPCGSWTNTKTTSNPRAQPEEHIMGVLQRIVETAKAAPKRIVLCEAQDPRVLEAAMRAHRDRIADVILVGDPAQIATIARQHDLDISGITIADPATSQARERYAQQLYRLREKKGMTLQQAQQAVAQPLCFANLMLHMGDADGSVAGAVHTTADVVRTALQVVGAKASAGSIVSSFFLMIFEHEHHPTKGGMIFSDCGLVIDPDAQQLARIALDS